MNNSPAGLGYELVELSMILAHHRQNDLLPMLSIHECGSYYNAKDITKMFFINA